MADQKELSNGEVSYSSIQESIIDRIGGPFSVFWVVLGAFASSALGIFISVILAKYGTFLNWSHAVAYSILSYSLVAFIFSNIIFYLSSKKAEKMQKLDIRHAIMIEKQLEKANTLYEMAIEKSKVLNRIVEDVEKIKSICDGQEKHIKAIVQAAEEMSGALITIDEAVRIEYEAEKEVYVISVDPKLEFNIKFYNVICHNLLRGIQYSYFFPNSDPVRIEREWKQLVAKLKGYKGKDGETIDDQLLNKFLKIFVVDRIHILNNIVLIDPNEPAKTKCWVFPIIENENLIVSAGDSIIMSAIEQTTEWKRDSETFQKYPVKS